ncbi:helix-turn-helix domain-containing protein [Demequina sp.]|uniref:helix-turn-helix domain-containing protein n=1 Tax=Demequina sp. TaxID=2050685 RepID=UPI003D0D1695
MSETLPDRIFLPQSDRDESLALAAWLATASVNRRADRALGAPPSLTPQFAATMARVFADLARGRTLTIGALPDELTTTVAAEQAGVSRPTLMKWIRDGELAAHKVGSHTRVKTADLLALRRSRAVAQREALAQLLALEDELDIS